MKVCLYILVFAGLYLTGCKPGKKEAPVSFKKKDKVNYAARGFENLNESTVMKDILCQTWDFKEDVADTKDLDITSSLEVVYRSYCFFSDGKLVKDPRGDVKIGRWSVNVSGKPIIITIDLDNEETESWQLAYLMPYEMILAKGSGSDRKTVDLSSDALRHINIKEDPFYADNISWRIHPGSPETDKEIKKRLKDYIHFFVLFYDQKIKSEADAVSFIGLPTCYNWYSGAVSIQGENELQKKWINCFYNREQAMKAYRIADKLIRKKYALPEKEGNWLKANVSILKGMENKVDSID